MQSDLAARAGQIRHLPQIAAMNEPRFLAAKRARRGRRLGMRCDGEAASLLYDPLDGQALGHKACNLETKRHGAVSPQETAPVRHQKSSKVSQSPFCTPVWGPVPAPIDRIEPSVGSVGDSYDNALAETINGLYKA